MTEPHTDDPIRVFVLDDHEIVRRALVDLFDRAGWQIVGHAGGVGDARAQLPRARPDVVIADVHLSDGSGIGLCAEMRPRLPGCAWVMLTSDPTEDTELAARRAGANGLVLKNARAAELLHRVRAAAVEQASRPSSARVPATSDATRVPAALERLTAQERQLLELLVEGLTNREIAREMVLSEKTVKNYLSNLFRKLGVRHRTEAALLATRMMQAAPAASWATPADVAPVRF